MYNNITITNLTGDSISVLVTITPPSGWQLTTQKILTVSIPGYQNSVVSMRMLPSKSISAEWEKTSIEYRLNDGLETLSDTFKVRVQEFMKFKARVVTPNIVLGAYQKNLSFPVYVKNSGNTAKSYSISFYNQLLNLAYKQDIFLNPNEDTVYNLPLRLSEAQWGVLRREEVKVQVRVEDGETVNLVQELSKIGYMLKQNSSAYLDLPLQLETGATYQGESDIQYYGALHGRLDLSQNDKVMFDVRSKTFTQGQFLDNDIYNIEYEGYHWYASAGNVMQLSDFVINGYGARAGYKWKGEVNRVGVYGLIKSRTGNNRLFGADAEFLVKEKMKLFESAIVSLDRVNNLNSYLLKQNAVYKIGKEAEVKLITGVGLEEATGNIVNTTQKSQVGSSLGYNFMWNHKRFNITSNVLYNSNSYPGVFKGQRVQIHDGRLLFGRFFVGGFFEYNLRKQNIYTDTQFFSNVFNLKTRNYGARTGVSFKNTSLTLSAGKQRQQNSDTGTSPAYIYDYLNLIASRMLGEKSYININTYYGRGHLEGYEDTTSVNVMSNQGSLQVYFAGLSARYDIGPYFYHEYIKYIKNPEKYSRLVLGPYAEVSMFKRSLTIRGQYNYNTSEPAGTESSNVLGNIVYRNYKHSYDLNITGMAPLNKEKIEPYVTMSFRIMLHTPFVPVRKYYNLKLILYKDENVNGKFDEGEGKVAGQMLSLSNDLFVSNEDGEVIFKNVEKKDFRADFGYTSKIKGWIPQEGTRQTFTVTGNNTIYVPYKKSKVLSGKLNINLDKNSNLDFKVSNIKVIATGNDSLRSSYSTLTDENGEFSFNLPAGIYTVSLSQLAFDDQFQPTEFAKQVDLVNNDTMTVYFDIKQKRRSINIRKKK
ncbi:MAG: carboxypeptidase regulatory-like domain-containing protein [Chitinophagales bacterium]|nr:carboxypeptidase regulatory-like domain-containing protein [Chitinophagaceae bacterium]MCB9065118.1 carboxypeptidase regulatory-like domain-containing protein [Chitinophagales bacterium]